MGAEGAAGAMDRAAANGMSETRAALAGAPAGVEALVFSGANPTARLAAGALRPGTAATVRGAQARTIAGAALRDAEGAESETAKGLAAGDLSAGGVTRSAAEMALVSGAHVGLETFGRFRDAAAAERAATAAAAARTRERNAAIEEARSAMEERTVREGEAPALYDRIGEGSDRAEAAPPAPPVPPADVVPPRLTPETMASADAAAAGRKQAVSDMKAAGIRSLGASPNAEDAPAKRNGSLPVVTYTPQDGTGSFRIGKRSFEHGLRGAERADSMLVGAHLGEALDASLAMPERTQDARFRMAMVTLDGEPAHVLFTIEERTGEVSWSVLKGFNAKREAASTALAATSGGDARAFAAAPATQAQLMPVWQEKYRPGIEKHNAAKGRKTVWTTSAPAVPGEQLDDTFDFGAAAPAAVPSAAPAPAPAVAPGVQTPGSPPAAAAPPRLTPEAMAEADAAAAQKWRPESLAKERETLRADLSRAMQAAADVGQTSGVSAAISAAEKRLAAFEKRLAKLDAPAWARDLPRPSQQDLAMHDFPLVRTRQVPFNSQKAALLWAKENGVIGTMTNTETGGKGEISISAASVAEMLNAQQRIKSASNELHYAAVANIRDLIRAGEIADRHSDRLKGKDGRRSPDSGVNPDVAIDVVYAPMFYEPDGRTYRVKITLKRFRDKNQKTKAYAYKVSEIEVPAGTLANSGASAGTDPRTGTSIRGDSLLRGVLDVKGNLLVVVPENIEAEVATPGGSGGEAPRPSQPGAFALDGGTPAEIAAERQRAALAARRAELEAQAAAPGPDLGTVSVQEGLPGLGGDGTLFTPPPGGWGAAPRAPSSGALADAGAASPSMLEEAMAESARGGWGDESKTVPVVGGTEPVWRPVPGKSASEMKAELKTAAERDIQAQPNRFYDPERRVHGLLVDGVRHYLNPSGMMHGIVGRRGAANGAAVARIGTVLNASVAVPGVPGDQAFRIAPVNFGAPGHALFVFDTVGGENKLADILVLHSLNVKAGTAARPRLATNDSRPTTETLAQLREAWQVDFLPGLKERARQKAAGGRGALADAAPEPAVRPSSGSVAADVGEAPREGPAATRRREDAALVRTALDAYRRNLAGEGNLDELSDLARQLLGGQLPGVRRSLGGGTPTGPPSGRNTPGRTVMVDPAGTAKPSATYETSDSVSSRNSPGPVGVSASATGASAAHAARETASALGVFMIWSPYCVVGRAASIREPTSGRLLRRRSRGLRETKVRNPRWRGRTPRRRLRRAEAPGPERGRNPR